MDFNYVLNKRRSVRDFDPKRPVNRKSIEEMIAAAQKAPSWKNAQASRYYAVITPTALNEIRQKCLPDFNQQSSRNATALIITTFVKTRSGFTRQGGAEDHLGNGWGCLDLGLQIENLLLKATELGLGTLVMGIRDAASLRSLLQIPDDREIGPVIAVGYTNVSPEMPKRKPTTDIVSFI